MGYTIIGQYDFANVFILLKRSNMNTLEDLETGFPFEIRTSGDDIKKNRLKRSIYPVLIVETLSKTFGIDKIDNKKQPNISKEEGVLLNLIARIIVEIFIKEEL